MTTPSGYITLSDIAAEIGVGATGLTLDNSNVRTLAGKPSGFITLDDLRGKSWNQNFISFHGPGQCYSGQAGFSLDRISGSVILTMGAWPTDPPNCQTCDSAWLQGGGVVNSQRAAANSRPFWTNVWTLNIDNIAIGSSAQTRAPNWPYTNVPYTYVVTRTGANSLTIERYDTFGTGDTGTSISVSGWGSSFDSTAGTRTGGGWSITTVAFASSGGGGGTPPSGDTGGGDGGGDGGTGDSGSGDSGSGDGGSGDGGGGDGGGGGGGDGE